MLTYNLSAVRIVLEPVSKMALTILVIAILLGLTTSSALATIQSDGNSLPLHDAAHRTEITPPTVLPTDYGDAPDSFATFIASGGPSHVITPDLYLGDCVDGERDGAATANATGDDIAAGDPVEGICEPISDDEDGVTLVTPLIAGNQACLTINAVNNGDVDATLYGWIDFNGDGDFGDGSGGDVDEFVVFISGSTVAAGGANDQSACFTAPVGATFAGGETHMRFRLTTDALTAADWGGPAADGEVEDTYTALACVGNYVWNDTGGTEPNLQDVDDRSVAELAVDLVFAGPDGQLDHGDQDQAADDLTYRTTTNASGVYAFCGLPPSTRYQIRIPYPPGDLVAADWGDDDDKDSDGTQLDGSAAVLVADFTIPASIDLPIDEDGIQDIRDVDSYPDNRDQINFDVGFTLDSFLAVSLSYVSSERKDDGSISFTWETATETAVAGFNILAETVDRMVQLNGDLIASKVIDSVVVTRYEATLATAVDNFSIQEVRIDGSVEPFGPFQVGQSYGSRIEQNGPKADSERIFVPLVSRLGPATK